MAEFHFVTTWKIEAPLPQVFGAITQCLTWPAWWKGVEKVEELDPGNADGIGSLRRFIWKGMLPYRLNFLIRIVRAEPLKIIEGQASGDVEGVGCWHFSHDTPITTVRYEWHVRTTRLWMNLLLPVVKPLVRWNHDQLMKQGGEGLARLLNARLACMTHGHL